jgi:hypothetical protein
MKRATPAVLFLGSNYASICAFLAIRKLAMLSLGGAIGFPDCANVFTTDLPREYWAQGLMWLPFAVVLTIAFLLTARGRWRFAAALPLTICAYVVLGLVVQNHFAFA